MHYIYIYIYTWRRVQPMGIVYIHIHVRTGTTDHTFTQHTIHNIQYTQNTLPSTNMYLEYKIIKYAYCLQYIFKKSMCVCMSVSAHVCACSVFACTCVFTHVHVCVLEHVVFACAWAWVCFRVHEREWFTPRTLKKSTFSEVVFNAPMLHC